jgi:hypothetical protein
VHANVCILVYINIYNHNITYRIISWTDDTDSPLAVEPIVVAFTQLMAQDSVSTALIKDQFKAKFAAVAELIGEEAMRGLMASMTQDMVNRLLS